MIQPKQPFGLLAGLPFNATCVSRIRAGEMDTLHVKSDQKHRLELQCFEISALFKFGHAQCGTFTHTPERWRGRAREIKKKTLKREEIVFSLREVSWCVM